MVVVDILIFLVALLVIITIHEFGHFFVAKLANVLCHEFAIGLGFYLFSTKKGKRETRFSIKGIPFGGYAAMAGEDEASSYLKKGDVIGLVLDEKKYVTKIVLGKKDADVRGKVVYFNVYNDDHELYITIENEDKLLKYLVSKNAEYVFDKGYNMQNAPKSRSFEAKPKMARFLILFGGPMMNFVLAIFLFMIAAALNGKPVTTKHTALSKLITTSETITIPKNSQILSIGTHLNPNELVDSSGSGLYISEVNDYLQQHISTKYILKYSEKHSEAKTVVVYPRITLVNLGISNEGFETNESGVIVGKVLRGLNKKFSKGDKIIKVNDTTINSWEELIKALEPNNQNKVKLTWLKSNKDGSFETTPTNTDVDFNLISLDTLKGQGINAHYVVDLKLKAKTQFDLAFSLNYGFKGTWDVTKKTFATLKALFDGNSNIGITDLSGPVGIFQIVSQARQNGFASFLILVAFISVNIGILNLLPIPALDGGRIAFLAVEAVAGRKISKKFETKANIIAFILLMALMVIVLGLDIFKLIIH